MTPESVTGQTAPDATQVSGTQPARRTYGAGSGLPSDAACSDRSTAPAPEDDGKLLEDGPYVGARPFTAAETVLLAGREREADELANMVVAGTLTVVYGASGVGKTSLLNAKLPERLDPMDPGWGARTVAFGRWQPGFYQDLAQVIAPFAGGRDLHPGFLAASLIAAVQADDCPVTLVFDQFEEYFLYHPHGDGEFAPELARLANVRDSPVHIVLSLRSDGLFLLDRLRLRIPDIFRRLYQVLPLSEDGARDAIIEPLKRYNEAARRRGRQPVVLPKRDAPVVDALVKGSEDGRIRSLLGRGKGTGSTTRDPDTVVAPFLQLALLKLWVNTAGRSEVNNPIDVPPLLRLAANGGTGGPIDPVDAVRRIMQCHVAKVLRTFADLRTQRICAAIFSRMVTSEGGKVAVTVETAAAGLEPQDQAIVAAILARLASMSGEERLIRVAGDIEGQKTYEVQHDALGILLLDWVERWHREDAVRRARARTGTVVKRSLAVAALVALAGAGWLGHEQFAAKRDIVAQAEKFATSSSANGYRIRILTMLAALDDAESVWSKLRFVDTDHLQDLLRQMLHRAPRWGGVAASAGIDAAGSRLALVGLNMETLGESPKVRTAIYRLRPEADPSDRDCPLKTAPDAAAAAGSAALTGAPAIIDGPQAVGDQANPQLSFVGNEAAGFVGPEPCPVLVAYRLGTVSYWTGEADGWKQTKLDDLIDNYQTTFGPGSSGQIVAEMLPGVLQVRLTNQSDRSLRAAIIPDASAKPADPLRGGGFGPVIKFSSPPPPNPRRPPLLSAAIDYAAAFEQDPRNPLPGQLAGPVLALQMPGNPSHDARVAIAPPVSHYAAQYNAHYYRSLSATFVVKDGVTYAVVRTPSEVRVIRPPGDGANAPVAMTTFAVRPPYDSVVDTQSLWRGPPFAAARADDRWRFAWMTDRGIAVLDSSDPNALHGDESNQLNSAVAGKQPLLTSIQAASRLQLSEDGNILSLVHSAPGGAQRIEVWDLSKAWEERVDDPRLDLKRSGGALRLEACRIAAIEAGGDRLLPEEMENNLGRTVRQPCEGITATGGTGPTSPPAG